MSQTPTTSKREFVDFWQRRERWLMAAVPFLLLVLCVGVDIASRDGGFTSWAFIDLGAALLSAGLIVVLNHYDVREAWFLPSPIPLVLSAPALVAIIALNVTLVIGNPLYGFYTWSAYIWAFRLLPGTLRFAGIASAAVPVAISQTGSGSYATAGAIGALVAVWVVNASLASLFCWFGWVGDEQEHRRSEQVDELTSANARLAESLRENAELHERLIQQARDAGVSDERRRMAREIHDTLAQGLMGIITQLQAAQRDGGSGESAERRIDAAIDLARQSLTEARRSVAALAPAQLEGVRLPDAITKVARDWSDLHGIQAVTTTTGEPRSVPAEAEAALLRTAQEALANVAKHAHAGRVGLTLSYMDDLVTLDVVDDGVGFNAVDGTCPDRGPASAANGGGYGLSVMRQRIESVAGHLEVESEPDAGTAISATVPLAAVA